MSAFRKASVYVRDTFAGILMETDNGYAFAYDANYLASPDAAPVSLTLLLQEAPFESKTLFSFFDGLIPEGWLLHIVSKNWKIDQKDRFRLLLVACRDCIGAVRIEEDAQ